MASIYPIITIPDPVLRTEAAPVERVDDALRKLMDDMLATMYDAPGVGLAAPQIGVQKQIFVWDLDGMRDALARCASGARSWNPK